VTALCPGPVETGFAEVAGIDDQGADALPRFMWVSSEDVASEAIAGMEKGRQVVIPGVPNRIGAAVGHLAPRRLLLPLLASRHPSLKD
jgi:short-subunit dehydrogenase